MASSRSLGFSWPATVAGAALWIVCMVFLIAGFIRLIAPENDLVVLFLFGVGFAFCSMVSGIYFVIVVDKAREDRVHLEYTRRLERELGIDRDD